MNSLSSAATIPQVQYQDLGLTLKVTPSIERTADVALKFDFKITALQGSTLNGLPVLTNESYTADIVVKTGASAMLVSDLSRHAIEGGQRSTGVERSAGFPVRHQQHDGPGRFQPGDRGHATSLA